MAQENYAVQIQNSGISEIMSILERNSPQKLNEEQMFIAKEEYLNQYRENNFWVIFPHLFQLNSFFNHVACQGVNKEVKEQQEHARKKIMRLLIDSRSHRTFNNLHRTNCVKLEEKYVTTMLQPNVVEVPI